MTLQFWKHKKRKAVITQSCYDKLPQIHQSHFEATDEDPTHYVEDGTNFIAPLWAESAMLNNDPSNLEPIIDSPQDNTASFDGFGGGDFGGGGSSDNW